MFWNDIKEIKEGMGKLSSALLRIECRLDDFEREQRGVDVKTMDRLDDCMKNVTKLDTMINELKGCVSLARGALSDRKDMESHSDECMKELMRSFENLRGDYNARMEDICKEVHAKRRRRWRRKKVKASEDA